MILAATRVEGKSAAGAVRLAAHHIKVAAPGRNMIGVPADVGYVSSGDVRPDGGIRHSAPKSGFRGEVEGSRQGLAGGNGVGIEGKAARYFRSYEAAGR